MKHSNQADLSNALAETLEQLRASYRDPSLYPPNRLLPTPKESLINPLTTSGSKKRTRFSFARTGKFAKK